MVSFKDTRQPLYDDNFYLETDLDTIDDQPIDYSKRFVDEEPDAVCGSSAGKKKHLSTPSVNVDPPKVPGDELKVYCFEGTPLLISSASSLCDLREIGVLLQTSETGTLKEHLEKEPDFQASNTNKDTRDTNGEVEMEKHEPTQPEKKGECHEEEGCVNFQTEGSFSKTSSPLMFSRSSSVGSLNSYENQSIVDDRSSVSIFSTLPSGIISPSEIPDSPGEVMSPFIHKGKQTEFLFPSSNNNERSMDPILDKIKMNSNQSFDDNAFEDIPEEDNIKVYNEEGDCSSMTNLSDLSIQIDSSNVSVSVVHHKSTFLNVDHKSSIRVSCSIPTTDTVQNHNIEDLNSSKVEADCAKSNKNCAESCSYTDSGTMLTSNYAAQDVGMTDLSFPNLVSEKGECTKDGTPASKNAAYHNDYKSNPVLFEEEQDETMTFHEESESSEFSKDNSDDDETDALLDACIKSGMPNKNTLDHIDSKQSLIQSSQSGQMSISKEDIQEQNSSFSDNDSSEDENDPLLESCIQLGKPQKLSNNQIQDGKLKDLQTQVIKPNSIEHFNACSNNSKVPDMVPVNCILKQSNCNLSLPQNAGNRETSEDCNISDDDDDDELLNQCIKLGMSNPSQGQKKLAETRISSTFHPITKNKNKQEIVETETKKSDEDSDVDESDLLVQQCIQLGRPSNKHKSSNDRKMVKDTGSGSPDIKELGYRDNCPDGTSDVDEDDDDDDDIVSACIRAGMPNPKALTSEHKIQYVLPNKKPSLKPQLRRKSPAAEDRAMFLKKSCFSNSMQSPGYLRDASVSPTAVVDDYMCVYTTEDTPILSPSASISDLSTLSFNDDKSCQESFLNNSRNSDCSSESDDELLQQCIRSGMPDEKRAVA